MGQAASASVVDLPDPSQSAGPGDAKNADDLLSQLAGDEIDRLLAENDSPSATTNSIPRPTEIAAEPGESPKPLALPIGEVLDTAARASSAAAPVVAATPVKPPRTEPQIDLGQSARIPLLFRPLQWLSAPLDPWPDQLREIMGKIGLITLINALAVLAYVLLIRRHHH